MKLHTHFDTVTSLDLTHSCAAFNIETIATQVLCYLSNRTDPRHLASDDNTTPFLPIKRSHWVHRLNIMGINSQGVLRIKSLTTGAWMALFEDLSALVMLDSDADTLQIVPWAFTVTSDRSANLRDDIDIIIDAFRNATPLALSAADVDRCLSGQRAYPFFSEQSAPAHLTQPLDLFLHKLGVWLGNRPRLAAKNLDYAVFGLMGRSVSPEGDVQALGLKIALYSPGGSMKLPTHSLDARLNEIMQGPDAVVPLSCQFAHDATTRRNLAFSRTYYHKPSLSAHERILAITEMNELFGDLASGNTSRSQYLD
jgi:hypothetical protein